MSADGAFVLGGTYLQRNRRELSDAMADLGVTMLAQDRARLLAEFDRRTVDAYGPNTGGDVARELLQRARVMAGDAEPDKRLSAVSSLYGVTAWATDRAEDAKKVAAKTSGEVGDVYAALAGYVEGCELEPPRLGRLREQSEGIRTRQTNVWRMLDSKWWKYNGRKHWLRVRERAAIKAGKVHLCQALGSGLYLSDDSFAAICEQRGRNRQTIERQAVVNEAGDVLTIAEASASSEANPANRRVGLAVRARGMEDYAQPLGHVAMFYVMSLASKYHARHWTGAENAKWRAAGSPMPDDGNRRMMYLWERIRVDAWDAGLHYYGVRTMEPHHDGTPHMNVLAYCADQRTADRLTAIIQKWAFKDEPDEDGAAEHRVKVKKLDWAEGSPTGYVMKYISKNIDGHGLDVATVTDDEGRPHAAGDAKDAARRATAWASLWAIRQFAMIGAPPVTVFRELRRLDGECDDADLEAARKPADETDYAAHVDAMGGFCVPREFQRLGTYRVPDEGKNRYEEPRPKALKGVQTRFAFMERGGNAEPELELHLKDPVHVITRPHQWQVMTLREALALTDRLDTAGNPKGDSGWSFDASARSAGFSPWARVNNCRPLAPHLVARAERKERRRLERMPPSGMGDLFQPPIHQPGAPPAPL
jgi:hypothetical protein